MPVEARFVKGDTVKYIRHTPAADVAAGEIVVIEGIPYVAHHAITANTLGNLAAEGGEYELLKDGTSGPDIAQGESVAWIEGSNLATDVITGNVHFGTCTEAAGASASTVRALHRPILDATNEST
jgi:predicted RecA/RadA family phage recombinase